MNIESTRAAIVAEIQRRQLTPTQLERMAGISHRAAWVICSGESESISWNNLDRCLAALGMRIEK